MAKSEVHAIARAVLRAANGIFSEVQLTTLHAEPNDAERAIASFIRSRGYRALTPAEAAAFTFRIVVSVIRMQKLDEGYVEPEIDDNAVLPLAPERKTMKGAE
jgi:hypothetical protein